MSGLTFETAAQAEAIAKLPEVRDGQAFERDSFANPGNTGPIFVRFGSPVVGCVEYLVTECGEVLRGECGEWEPFDNSVDGDFFAWLRNRPGGAVDPDRCSDEVLDALHEQWREVTS